jgi:hypothetical protein
LAPLLAEKVLGLEQSIASGEFDGKALDSELILLFHAAIAGELVPEWAGRWRTIEVRVGQHQPPLPHQVRTLISFTAMTYALGWNTLQVASTTYSSKPLPLQKDVYSRFIHSMISTVASLASF